MPQVQRNRSTDDNLEKRLSICPREEIEQFEIDNCSPYAALSAHSAGRETPRPKDDYRTEYQRDRDRILHCKSFRRLSHKTQVFIAPEGDHYRTRLTHTLEVSQIARSIARTLRLNEDLSEAIALGHDLGHSPFGHAGEAALAEVLVDIAQGYDDVPSDYHHAKQSLRVVEVLEYEGKGLNLTAEVRDGILGHSGTYIPKTLEGQIVRIADRIAYINHDIDDAIRAGVLLEVDLPKEYTSVLGNNSPERITRLVTDLIEQSEGKPKIMMTKDVKSAMHGLRNFMFDNVYESKRSKAEEPKARGVVSALFYHYLENRDDVPIHYYKLAENNHVQAVIDYVSGMTDRFALREYERLFVPLGWSL